MNVIELSHYRPMECMLPHVVTIEGAAKLEEEAEQTVAFMLHKLLP